MPARNPPPSRRVIRCASPDCRRQIPIPWVKPDGRIEIAATQGHLHSISLLILAEHVRIDGRCRGCNRAIPSILLHRNESAESIDDKGEQLC